MNFIKHKISWLIRTQWLVKIHFIFWLSYFSIFWSHTIEFDAIGNLFVNQINLWGDWPAHFTIGSNLAFKQLFTLESPFLINQTFSYPFAANLISALLIRLKVPFFAAFIIPSYLGSLLIVISLYLFYQKTLKSKKLAILASNLFLFNGGLGFIYFFQDLFAADKPWSIIISPPQRYTNIEPLFYRFISIINSMVIPQRAFNLGFPLALLALTFIYQNIFIAQKEPLKTKIQLIKLILIGIILGLMPWLHTHSFLATFIILTFWSMRDLISGQKDKLKAWFILALVVGLISLPLINLVFKDQVQDNFVHWFPGWYSFAYPEVNWWWFWLKNWGLIPILGLIGFILKSFKERNKWWLKSSFWFYLPFFVIFVLLNLFLFQPFIWDNTKLLVWAAVGFYGLAAYTLSYLWHRTRKIIFKILLVIIFLASILSGLIDNYRTLRFRLNHHRLYTAEELSLTDWARNNTPTNSVWLTGIQHNHWLFNLTGRQAVLTYPGWLWTHGYDYWPIYIDAGLMFEKPQQNLKLFKKYGVNYVILDNFVKRQWQANVNDFTSSSSFELIKETPQYQIFSFNEAKP